MCAWNGASWISRIDTEWWSGHEQRDPAPARNGGRRLAHSGWSDRLCLIDRAGAVACTSAPGPFGFKPADLERALVDVLALQAAQ